MELNECLDRLANALIKDLERRHGKKLFTEGQLAEVAKMGKMEQAEYFGLSHSLPGYVAHAFDNTTGKMAEPETPADLHQGVCAPITPDETYDVVERPGAGGGRAIKFRRYSSIASEAFAASMMSAVNAADKLVYKNIIEAVRTLQHAAWENSKAHGWNEAVDHPASALMMITREVSELAEEERDASSGESTKIPGFSKKEEEAADIAIRLLSYCGARNMRLGAAICAKHEFNKTRPYRHGDKLF